MLGFPRYRLQRIRFHRNRPFENPFLRILSLAEALGRKGIRPRIGLVDQLGGTPSQMRSRTSNLVMITVGSYVLAWALALASDLTLVHPLQWFQLLIGILLTVAGISGVINPALTSTDQDVDPHARLLGQLTIAYVVGAAVLFFSGGFAGCWLTFRERSHSRLP